MQARIAGVFVAVGRQAGAAAASPKAASCPPLTRAGLLIGDKTWAAAIRIRSTQPTHTPAGPHPEQLDPRSRALVPVRLPPLHFQSATGRTRTLAGARPGPPRRPDAQGAAAHGRLARAGRRTVSRRRAAVGREGPTAGDGGGRRRT